MVTQNETDAEEVVAEWLYKWYQGGCAWVDVPESVKLRYRADAGRLLSLLSGLTHKDCSHKPDKEKK